MTDPITVNEAWNRLESLIADMNPGRLIADAVLICSTIDEHGDTYVGRLGLPGSSTLTELGLLQYATVLVKAEIGESVYE